MVVVAFDLSAIELKLHKLASLTAIAQGWPCTQALCVADQFVANPLVILDTLLSQN